MDENDREVLLDSNIRYRGQWQNGRQHGIGEVTYPDGSSYIGQFTCGKPNGQNEDICRNVVQVWACIPIKTDLSCKGISSRERHAATEFTLSRIRASKGQRLQTAGVRYYGPFIEDKREGRGREIQSNGMEYIGNYK